jgi:flagellar basal-body rod protein FlgG
MRIGAGAAVVDGGRDFGAGAFQTGSNLSVAISGPGFLQVRTADNRLALTRNGDIQLDSQGTFTLASGQRLVPTIRVPKGVSPDDISIASDGTVAAKSEKLGKLTLVSVRGQGALQPIGDSLFLPTAASGAPTPISGSRLEQGYLESSNVNLADAMVGVIDAQRSFQFDSRVITTQDQLMEIANQIRH